MSADSYRKQGDAFFSKQQWQKAIDAYENAIKLQPNNSVLYRLLAAAQEKTGGVETAIVNYQKAIKLKPEDNFWGYRNLADLLFSLERWDEAINNYEKAIIFQPQNSFTYRQLARAKVKTGKIEGAIANYSKAIETNSQFFKNYKDLAELLCRQKRWDEAIAIYEKAAALQPDNDVLKAELELISFKADVQKQVAILNALERAIIWSSRLDSDVSLLPIRKILFVVCHLPEDKNSGHLQVIFDYSILLLKNYINIESVSILITNELYSLYSHSHDAASSSKNYIQILQQRLSATEEKHNISIENKINFIYGQPNSQNYFLNVMSQVAQTNPDVVIFWGGMFGSKIFPDIFYELYPTVFMQFNNKSNFPKSNFDIYLSCGKVKNYSDFINPDKWRHHNYLYYPNAKSKEGTKNIVKSSPNTIALVTVTGYLNRRLVDNSIITEVVKIMKKYPQVCWVLVGVTDKEELLSRNIDFRELASQDRVKLISYEADLRALYEQCDIYIHHRNPGGGYGMALAVCESLPVLVYEESDACNFLDESVIFSDNKNYFQFLEKLICSPELRKSVGRKLKALMELRSGKNSVEEFIGFCEEARGSFVRRKSVDSAISRF